MKILLLHAHPEPKSFTSALKDTAVDFFTKRGDEVIVSDLYQMNFNPVGVQSDFKSRANTEYFSYLKEQMNAHINNLFVDDLKAEMEKLKWADFLLINTPLWWSTFPAILKGWFDRVLALGFAYHPREKLYENGVFKGKKAMLSLTAGASEQAYTEQGANGDIMKVLFHIHHGILYYIGMDVLPPFIAWRAHLEPRETLEKYIENYKQYLSNTEKLKPLF